MTALVWILLAHTFLLVFFTPAQGLVLGVQNKDLEYFEAAEKTGIFRCLDNSSTIPFRLVNDDVCDCPDGSDEPGTSSCILLSAEGVRMFSSEWKFQCTDQKHILQTIPHSRVGDGICDCCDGSDETGSFTCPNRCAEVASDVARQLEVDKARKVQAAESKAVMRSAAQRRREEAAKSLPGLESEHARIVANISVLEERKAAANAVQEPRETEVKMGLDESKAGGEAHHFVEETASFIQSQQASRCPLAGSLEVHAEKPCTNLIGGHISGYCSCRAGFKDGAERGVDDEEMVGSSEILWYGFSYSHPELTCTQICNHNDDMGIQTVDEGLEDHSTLTSDEIEASLEEERERLGQVEKAIESAKKWQSSNITTEDLLRTLEKEEFTIEFHEQVYALVMFDKVYQRYIGQEEGGTLLGSWKSMGESTYSMWAKDSHDLSTMIYDDGLRCWNGVKRNVELRLVCGPENKLLLVEEPSMCNYRMLFETPALCDD